jgi:hypothetical protein
MHITKKNTAASQSHYYRYHYGLGCNALVTQHAAQVVCTNRTHRGCAMKQTSTTPGSTMISPAATTLPAQASPLAAKAAAKGASLLIKLLGTKPLSATAASTCTAVMSTSDSAILKGTSRRGRLASLDKQHTCTQRCLLFSVVQEALLSSVRWLACCALCEAQVQCVNRL